MDRHRIHQTASFCLDFVAKGQLSNGEFRTLLYFPGRSENGWIYSGPSVFITACIGIALLDSTDGTATNVSQRAAGFVHSQMEKRGLWRFYPHNGLFRFNTPMDVDDTALASYLLKRCNIEFPDNRKLMLMQLDGNGAFLVWFLPRFRYLATPSLFWSLCADLRHSLTTFFPMEGRTEAPLIRYDDHEHAVTANALLYLGKGPETQRSINHLTEDLLFAPSFDQLFYPDMLFTYFHVSRAYREGIEDLGNLKARVVNHIAAMPSDADILCHAVALITLMNFGADIQSAMSHAHIIAAAPHEVLASPFPYFCTKDRNMLGGSSELTCAFVYEALTLFLERYTES